MSIERTKVVFRADGNNKIGLGHVVRCCALADILKENFDCYFYIRKTVEAIAKEIEKYCVSINELDDNISYEQEANTFIGELSGDEIVVLDGYSFNTAYQSKIKSKGCKLVCIDDIHAYHFVADAVINHAPCISKEAYSCEPYTKLYLGTGYVLLKKIFLQKAASPNRVFNFDTSPILICLGGADPNNITLKVLNEVRELFIDREIFVVVGAAYSCKDLLKEYCEQHNGVSAFININAEELITLMESTQIAITSASTVALEYMCIKGNLFLLKTADNQAYLYKTLIEKKCAYPYHHLRECYNSTDIHQNQLELIDGKSSERLLSAFTQLT